MLLVKTDNEHEVKYTRHIDQESGDYFKDGRFSIICKDSNKLMDGVARAIIYHCKECDSLVCISLEDEPDYIKALEAKDNE